MASSSPSSSSAAAAAAAAAAAVALGVARAPPATSFPRPSARVSFSCAVCDIQFSDSHAAEAHKASRKHKKKSGELEWEERQYKKDVDVTPDDVWALVRRKQEELEVVPWSELRYKPADAAATR